LISRNMANAAITAIKPRLFNAISKNKKDGAAHPFLQRKKNFGLMLILAKASLPIEHNLPYLGVA